MFLCTLGLGNQSHIQRVLCNLNYSYPQNGIKKYSDLQALDGHSGHNWSCPFVASYYQTLILDTDTGPLDRILICAFSYVNCLIPEVLIERIQLLSLVKNDSAIRHMQSFYALVERGRNYSLYALNVSMRRYEWLDGRPRIYLNRERR